MHDFHKYLRATPLGVIALACTGLAAAQNWSTPVLVANGNGQAVSTNGARYFCGHFHPCVWRGTGFCQHGKWLVGSNHIDISQRGGQHRGRTEWRCVSRVEFPHHQHVHASRSPGRFLPRRALGQYSDHFDQRLGNVSSLGLPSIAFDGFSQATVVWEQITNPSPMSCGLEVATGNATTGFGSAKTISTASTCFGWNKLAVSSGGQAVAVEGVPGILSGAVVAIGRDSTGNVGRSRHYRGRRRLSSTTA